MSLQLEKSDEVAKSKVRVTAYQNHFSKDSPASYGRVQAPSDRVTASNLVASLATRHFRRWPWSYSLRCKTFARGNNEAITRR